MAKQIDSGTVDAAIEIFSASQSSKTVLGKRVLAKLKSMPKSSFQATLLPLGTNAHSDGSTITVSTRDTSTPAEFSLQFVHEGVHVVLKNEVEVEQEMHAYELTATYYLELRKGISLKSSRHLIKRRDAQETALEKIRKQKLVDWLVQEKWIAKAKWSIFDHLSVAFGFSPKVISDAWVMKHHQDWGSLSNREWETLVVYVRTLVDANSVNFKEQDVLIPVLEHIAKKAPKGKITFSSSSNTPGFLRNIYVRYADPPRAKRLLEACKKLGLDLNATGI